jgi:glycine/D-amino acid oxidase-like deaminating enzyme
MRIAVIGIGGTGSAAARFLASAGHEVVGFEQFRLGHERGSSHGESRIIRYTYPDPFYTRLMRDAYPLWAALEAEAREELFVRCGGLYFGRADHRDLDAVAEALGACGLPFEDLTPREVGARYPAFRLGPNERAIFQEASGFLRATRCVLANARLARARGATIHEETVVRAVEPIGGGGRGAEVRIERGGAVGAIEGGGAVRGSGGARAGANGETLRFDAAIVTAGPWMGRLLARLGLPLTVTRQEIVYLRVARNAERFAPARFPVWIDAGALMYGIPMDGRVDGVKVGAHHLGAVVDPDRRPSAVEEAAVRRVAAYAAERFPDLAAEATHTQACLYTNTPDEDFIVDRVPGAPDIWLVSGCSGHGFKFTVLLGKIAAELATEGKARGAGAASLGEERAASLGPLHARDLARFALARFR